MAVCVVSLPQRAEHAWQKLVHVFEPGVLVRHLTFEDERVWDDCAPFASTLHFLALWVALETMDLDAVLGLGDDWHSSCGGERAEPQLPHTLLSAHFSYQSGIYISYNFVYFRIIQLQLNYY